MRNTFIKTLAELAEKDPRIMLLSGDLGYMAVEPFSEKFESRFFNVGIAEQNMVGLATGLAEAGFMPFVYSIVTFAVLRSYEFIRNGPILHKFPVRIIGIGGGVEYGHNGITHYGLEDVAVMRTQPGITVITPADYEQTKTALLATWDLPGPVYYRLGKDEKTKITGLDGRFELGRVQFIDSGKDVLIVAMGSVASEAALTVKALAVKGIHATMAVVASVNPAPADDLAEALSQFRLALTVEAHYITGGLGSMISEIVADQGLSCKVIRRGISAPYDGLSGSQAFLYDKHGLSSSMLADTVHQALSGSIF